MPQEITSLPQKKKKVINAPFDSDSIEVYIRWVKIKGK